MKKFTGERDWIKFRDYLQELAKNEDGKPFNCPLLAVLPEPVKYPYPYGSYGQRVYPPGTLLCSAKIGSELITRSICCNIERTDINLNKENQFQAFCAWNGSKFTLSIISFEPKKYSV